MTNKQPDLQSRWFIPNYAVAAIDEPADAKMAMDALRQQAGFPPEELEHLSGEEAASQIDTSGEHSGTVKQITRAVWGYISIQASILRELEKTPKREVIFWLYAFKTEKKRS